MVMYDSFFLTFPFSTFSTLVDRVIETAIAIGAARVTGISPSVRVTSAALIFPVFDSTAEK